MVIWILGLSGSGKSYLSNQIKKRFKKKFILIDGDVIRDMFGNDVGQSLKDRKVNAMRISKLVAYLSKNNIDVLVSVLSIFPEWLNWNKKNIKNYHEIFLDVSIGVLKKRNNKFIYFNKNKVKKRNVVGIDISFPKPINPDLILNNKFNKKNLFENLDRIRKKFKIK